MLIFKFIIRVGRVKSTLFGCIRRFVKVYGIKMQIIG